MAVQSFSGKFPVPPRTTAPPLHVIFWRVWVLAALVAAASFEAAARYANLQGLPVLSEILSLFAVFSLVLPQLILIPRLQDTRLLRWMVIISSACLLLSQAWNVHAEILWAEALGPIARQISWTLFLAGFMIMLVALYWAFLEMVATKMRLIEERAELAREVAQRQDAVAALQSRVRYQALLQDLGQFALACGTAGELLDRAGRMIAEGLEVTRSAVWRFGEKHGLVLAAGVGWGPGLVGHYRLPVSSAGMSDREASLERIVLPDAAFVHDPGASPALAESLTVPFGRSQQCSGLLSAYSEPDRTFSSEELAFLEGMSHTVAVTLERLRAEEALLSNERYSRALLDNALDLITVLNADGTIRYESASIRHVLGYAPEELVGHSVFSYVHPEDLAKVVAKFTHTIKHPEETATISFRCRHQDGSYRVLESVGRNLLADDDIRGAIVNSRDVTERIQLEQQLTHAQKMEGIGRLAGGVAHDFNNLLTAITGYTQLSLATLAEEHKVRGHLEQVVLAAERAGALTRQLLSFARRQVVEPRVIDINDVVMSMDLMLRRLIGEHIELITHPRSAGAVLIDPGQLEQVILNLVLNARDAMPEGGRVLIETADQVLDSEYARRHTELRPGRYVMLAVSDTGCGISPELRANIFEPFFTTKEPGKGTGLGLATCYGIVQQAEGHIWVYSEPQRGATFKVFLPRVDVAAERVRQEECGSPTGGTECILLVEDDPLVRQIAADILAGLGYHLLLADTPQEAVRVAAQHPAAIDLLLTDVVLPVMGGRQLAEVLKEQRPGLRVLYMSGYTDDAMEHLGVLSAGAVFLSKPFTPLQLSQKIRHALDSEMDLIATG